MSSKKFSLILIFSIILTLGLSISLGSLLAVWTAPSVDPPDGNISAPINVSDIGQSKVAGLILSTGPNPVGLIVRFGNVGIGTDNPGAKLEVDTTTSTGIAVAKLGIVSSGWWGTDGAGYSFTGWATDTNPLFKIQSNHGEDSRDKIFQIFRSTDNYFTVQGGGNVGIGTTDPGTRKLKVVGEVEATKYYGDGSELTGLSGGKWIDATGGINYADGNVGIGTVSPGAKLDVAGNISASSVSASGNVSAAAPITAANHLTTKNYVDNVVAAAGGGGSPESWTCELRTASGKGGANAICRDSSYKLITGGCNIYYSGSIGTYTKADLTYDAPYLSSNTMAWSCICGRRDTSCYVIARAYCCK